MFKKSGRRTPKEMVDRAKGVVAACCCACAFLIYFMVKLLIGTLRHEGSMNQNVMVTVTVIMLCASAAVILIMVAGFIHSCRAGLFKEATYEKKSQDKAQLGAKADEETADLDEDAPSKR